jgi:DNA-binding NarL/FixJ family response regulator
MTVSATTSAERTRCADQGPRTPGVPPDRSPAHNLGTPRSPRGSPRESSVGGVDRALAPSPRVMIADHHPTSRFGMRLALERAGFLVVAECASGEDAIAVAAAFRPDACLIDVDIPGGGVVAARAITARAPDTAVVMLSAAVKDEDLLGGIMAGACGYLLKTIDPERLPVAVRAVIAGEAAIPRAFGRRLLEELRERRDGAAPPYVRGRQIGLTPRECQVVQLMRENLSTREIAARLGISGITVRRHVSAALRKLDAPDREAAVRLLQRSRTTTGRRFVR